MTDTRCGLCCSETVGGFCVAQAGVDCVNSKRIICNGTPYEVLSIEKDRDGYLLAVRRPKGSKTYVARPLPSSPLYGDLRGQILASMGRL